MSQCLSPLHVALIAAAHISSATVTPPNGKLRFQCRTCDKYGRHNPGSAAYDEKTKAMILAAYHERTSIRGLNRIFGVSRNTVAAWLKR